MTWIRAALVETLADNNPFAAVIEGKEVALYSVAGQVFATSNMCTHGHARLSEGYLEDHLIECPLHQGTFDVRTGAAVQAPCSIAVQSFPVKVEDGVVYVAV